MPSKLNPYLNFRTDTRAALEFYKTVFGGNLNIMTFGQGGMTQDPAESDKVMHGQLDTPNGFTLMASDVPPGMPFSNSGTNYSISLSGDDETELRGYWDRLAPGGQITLPLEKAPWGDTFGMLTDKFGTAWMVNIAGQRQ